jgi:hypothetical protein
MPISENENIPHFNVNIYSNIAMNDLVTYAVYFLSQSGREISDTDIVAICFLMFPKRFELRGYPNWPDSSVINKRWVDCRAKGLIAGSTKDGFTLTPKGMKLAERIGKTLGSEEVGKPKLKSDLRSRSGHFVREVENSIAYKNYFAQGSEAEIAEYDFRGMLLCTMESSPNTLRSNLSQFKAHIASYERQDLLDFLESMEERFVALLTNGTDKGKYKGGMLRQKSNKQEKKQ